MILKKKKIRLSPYLQARKTLKDNFPSDAGVLYFNFNLDENNKHIYLCGALYEKTLYIVRQDMTLDTLDVTKMAEPRCFQGVGCVSLECVIDGEVLEICRSDMSNAKALMATSKAIEAIIDGRAFDLEEKRSVCPICGTPYRTGSTKCTKCADKKKMIKRMLPFAKPYIPQLSLCVLLFAAVSGLNLLTPYLNKLLIDDYIKAAPEDKSLFIPLILAIALTAFAVSMASVARSIIVVKVGNKISAKFRDMVFGKVQEMTLSGVNKRTAGELITRITTDTATMKEFIVDLLPELFQQALVFLTIIPILFYINWKLAVMIILPMPIIIFLFYTVRHYINRLYHRQWNAGAELNTVLHDIFQGIRVVKVFGMEREESARFDKSAKKHAVIAEKNEVTWNLIIPFINFLMGIGEYAVLFYVGGKVIDDEMTLGQMSQLLSYVAIIYGPLRWMSFVPRRLSRAFTSISKVFEIVDEEPEITDAAQPVVRDITGNIKFENAAFSYDSYENVLHDINISINNGEMVGLVGRSGVGKSTLINLVMRLYELNGGSITIDGVDIRDYSQHCLRSQIGVVLQETFLFKGTIYSNIAYANPNATHADVIHAAKVANAHGFIMNTPDGYNTIVGEKGQTLSGGERQRIAIARAVLRDPKILILDEATSALDTETEKMIQDSLAILIKDRTTIAIAHRLSTLRNASRLVVLEKGTVEESGTHDELMEIKGRYYKLVMAQRQMASMAK